MKLLTDINVKGKRVLYRVDLNSAIKSGKIVDDYRFTAILPTLQHLLKHGAKQIILLAHQGRSKTPTPETRLDLHAKHLSKLLKKPVKKLNQSAGAKVPSGAKIVMLENVRLEDEDSPSEAKRMAFAKALAKLGDVYVNDAFGACHRDHATIVSLPKLMKEKAAGLLLQKEVEVLSSLRHGKVHHPFTVVIGGAKVDTKIGLFKAFMKTADHLLVGGAIANTFLFAEGYDIGESLCEENQMDTVQEIAMECDGPDDKLVIPEDVVCADEASDDADIADLPIEDIEGDMKIFDLGKNTIERFVEVIRQSKTVLWNGPLGLIECRLFRKGSEAIARAMAGLKATTVVGGGESVAVIHSLKIPHSKFTHVSTGGGAMMEFLSGKKLPGITALE